ncbi:hypothetical protein ACJ72_08684 [Emergomyces africanus]|uniref:Uncharacterized protein n=1 Tax=Emergomyces africanus TaxID=1955775 RepID=A0A1B7NJV8_9EURO|nr:hypothetical protein ACJ72_08684 [Emergomyces africanus]
MIMPSSKKKKKKKKMMKKKRKKRKKLVVIIKKKIFFHKCFTAVITALSIKHQIRKNSIELINVKDMKIEHLHHKNVFLWGKISHIECLLKMIIDFVKKS